MPYVQLFFAAIIWGGSFAATRYAVSSGGIAVATLLAARYAIATAALFAVVLARGWEGIRREDRRYFLAVSCVYPAAYMLFETHGIRLSSAAVSAVVLSGAPAMTAVLARLFLRERLSAAGWAGVAVSMAGVAAVAFLAPRGVSDGGGRTLFAGALMVAVAAVLAAVYVVSARHLMVRYRPLTLTLAQDAFGAAFFIPLAAVEFARGGVPEVSAGAVAAVCYLGVFASGAAFILFNRALKTLEAARTALFLNLIPVFGILFAWAILDERLSPAQGLGAAAVVGGVALAAVGGKRLRPGTRETPDRRPPAARTGGMSGPRRAGLEGPAGTSGARSGPD